MTLKLKHKIVALAIFSALLPAVVMSILTFLQKEKVENIVQKEMTELSRENLKYVAFDVYRMCEMSNALLSEKVMFDMNVARKVLESNGGVSLSSTEQVKWDAVNQFSEEIVKEDLPKMLVGGKWLGKINNFKEGVPVVDEVKKLVGGTCTIFQRMNEQGDLLRVATNVEKLDGTRAIGTYIPAVDPKDGSPNPVVSTIMSGKVYCGRAYVVNAWYITVYEPIRNKHGKIIGCLYVGVKLDAMEKIKKIIERIKIGNSGYVCVIGGTGKQRGKYIISKDGESDGDYILDSVDGHGKSFMKEIVNNSMTQKKGEVGFRDYPWKNKGELEARMKTGAYIYFEPWDWVVLPTMYEDDFSKMRNEVGGCIDNLLWFVMFGGLAIVIVSAIIATFLGGRIGDPISRIISIARMIAQGDIHGAMIGFKGLSKGVTEAGDLDESILSRDETGKLISSIVTMTKNLNSLVGQVQRSTIQLVSTATEIAASSKEQEATVNELGASTNEIVSSSKQISATSQQLVGTMNDVAQVSNQTAELADEGHASLDDMESTMEQLSGATDSISSKLSIINEKANNINNVVTTITKVADQTNLLSLNASIEAEKAGEYGKGFSVVAREIRRLADQTAVATLDIVKMVKDMQSAVSSGVMEMDKFSEEVRRGVKDVEGISVQLEKIIQQVQCLPPKFDIVTEGMKQQADGAQQISDSMVQLNDAARQTSDSLREFNDATAQLNDATKALKKEVSIFKVG
jgi:methyl-accepting chemotaxis protein WspA